VFHVEAAQVGAPAHVQVGCVRAGVPQPHRAVRAAAVGQPSGPDFDDGALDDREPGEQLCFQPGEVAGPLDFLVHAVPGADLHAAVTAGVRHGQQLVSRTLVRAGGELETLAVHAVAAGTGPAGTGPPVVEDPVAGDAHQQLDLQAVQRVGERGGSVALVQDEQRGGPPGRFLPGAQPGCQVTDLACGRGHRAGSLRQAPGVDRQGPRRGAPLQPITHWNCQPGTTLRSPSQRHGA
jgi:hypothetical protein